jgi:hypothetical protein
MHPRWRIDWRLLAWAAAALLAALLLLAPLLAWWALLAGIGH